MKQQKKIEKRLAQRQRGHDENMKARSDSKVEQRKGSGGYTRPGSRKKKGGL